MQNYYRHIVRYARFIHKYKFNAYPPFLQTMCEFETNLRAYKSHICITLIVNEGPENTLKPIVGVILYILHYAVYIMHYTHARIPMAIVSQLQCTADAGVFISLKWFEINIICNHVYAHAHAYYTMNTHITINQKRTKE